MVFLVLPFVGALQTVGGGAVMIDVDNDACF